MGESLAGYRLVGGPHDGAQYEAIQPLPGQVIAARGQSKIVILTLEEYLRAGAFSPDAHCYTLGVSDDGTSFVYAHVGKIDLEIHGDIGGVHDLTDREVAFLAHDLRATGMVNRPKGDR